MRLAAPASSLASQLPQSFELYRLFMYDTKSCGSWLASDEASGNDDEFQILVATKVKHIGICAS